MASESQPFHIILQKQVLSMTRFHATSTFLAIPTILHSALDTQTRQCTTHSERKSAHHSAIANLFALIRYGK